ncbi:uncharacterized protein I303_105067 [Kwoniella dejecticola CBS 10117]|uniref:Beta-lactamase-related domain-containing protein n=1 Tax=Kwoniella dejecticola CBS 10117 TaxID=1296121 RepID=A0A1A6A3J6_9TREE|nr:uncharacterized protein I303_05487 [Kwoniella dejecticola CBS 10117]OBR84628.1 hypothetical protein I303_05487 [Kwoniella dejecticola CBS 10117]
MPSAKAESMAHAIIPDSLLDEITRALSKFGVYGCHIVLVKGHLSHASSTIGTINGKDLMRIGDTLPTRVIGQLIRLSALHHALASKGHSLSTPIKEYIPELKMGESGVADKINAIDLASHMSGLPTSIETNEKDIGSHNILDKLGSIQPVHPFRSTYHETDIAQLAFEAIIERLTNQNYTAWIKAEVFDHLRMRFSTITEDESTSTPDQDQHMEKGRFCHSNGRDVLKFLRDLPKSPTYEELIKPYAENVEYPLIKSPETASSCLGLKKASYNGKDTYEKYSIGADFGDLFGEVAGKGDDENARLAVLCKFGEGVTVEQGQEFLAYIRGILIQHLTEVSVGPVE